MQIAAQLYTLRELTATAQGFRDALRRCGEIGFKGVQLSAVGCMAGPDPEVDAKLARTWLDEFGLVCCATHRPWERLALSIDEEIEFHQTLGCHYVALGGIGNEFGQLPESYRNFLVAAKPIADQLSRHEIRFGYHNHAHEFARDSDTGKPCIEILMGGEHAWLEMEVDTYWVADAGVCPADFLAQCQGRIHAIHVKDREVILGEGPVMAPVGAGNLNWNAILDVCSSGGTEWLIVEQDVCREDPFICLESSYNYLKRTL